MAASKDFPLISIITPIYNAEIYLVQSLESIINQSYPNTEIVLVNDGSTDSSQAICEEYTHKYGNIKLINQFNGGVASARNTGLKHSTGKFIIHVDSDDIILPNALEELYKSIVDNDAEIAVGNYIVRQNNSDIVITQSPCNSADEFLFGMLSGKYHAGLWNKLIDKKLYNGVEFINGINYMEDKLLLTKILLKYPKIIFIDKTVYIYRQNENSISNLLSHDSLESSYVVTKELCKLLMGIDNNSHVMNYLGLKHRLLVLLNTNNSINSIFKETDKNIFNNPYLSSKYKLLVWFETKNISFFTNLYKKLK